MSSEAEGQYGTFASYALHQLVEAPRGMVRYLASPVDEPNELVVLTVLDEDESSDLERALFFREVAAREARIKVDGVIPVREIGEHEGCPYIAREYKGGIELTELLEQKETAPDSVGSGVCATIVQGVVEGLRGAFRHGTVHLGLAAEDVIIDGGGDVSLTGFTEGNYRARYGRDESRIKHGAPELAKPEAEAPTASADSYAVGMLLYRLLTGREQPDEWEPRWSGMMMDLDAASVPGEALAPCIHFFHKTLAERPTQRFVDVDAVARAFQPVLMELDGPKPRQVVADAIREHLPPPPFTGEMPAVDPSAVRDVVSIDDEEDDDDPLASQEIEIIRSSSSPTIPKPPSTGPRDTRVLYNSQTSLRSLSPELREQIGAHPLQILARSRYQVLGELGSGGTGTVYKVLDTTLSEILALKVLRGDLVNDKAWLTRFKRELKITRDLEHPNILPAYHLEQLDGLYFFTMKFVDGETLYHLLHQQGPLSLPDTRRVLGKVGEALGAAHKRGIVHRDFKSANVMLERVTDQPFLMDFGIALAPDNPGLTMTGQGIGTPMYMAPEQAMGEKLGPRADIFSFGVVLYEALTGQLPFSGTTTVAVYAAQMKGKYRRITEVSSDVPSGLAELIEQCLRPEPDERPESMAEVLERFLGA